MNEILKNKYFYMYISLGLLLGVIIPLIFIVLDLKEMSLSFSFSNVYEVFKSQQIYGFSSILFPLLFGAIAGLFWYVISQNKKYLSQEHFIKDVLDSLSDSLLVCEASGKIKYLNRTFSMIYNESQTLESLFGIKNISEIESGKNLEFNLLNANNENHRVVLMVQLLKANSSNIEADNYIVSIRDIEELRKNEAIIEIQKAQLFESSKLSSLGEMASGFAHEINNPLAIIMGKLSLIEREVKKDLIHFDKEVILKHASKSKETVTRITKIIAGLRNISHADSGEIEDVTIEELIDDPVNMANLKMSGKGIGFKVENNVPQDEKVTCNKIQLGQVLINLLANSIFEIENQANPWLLLRIDSIDLNYIFTIKDSGSGIPLSVQAKMFEPMYTTKPVGKGTGLGLSISKSIIELHFGTLVIDNNCPNTSFVITLPKKVEHTIKVAS
jgi:C4-dicarboxylate-specific signal transduction histidine kinase